MQRVFGVFFSLQATAGAVNKLTVEYNVLCFVLLARNVFLKLDLSGLQVNVSCLTAQTKSSEIGYFNSLYRTSY